MLKYKKLYSKGHLMKNRQNLRSFVFFCSFLITEFLEFWNFWKIYFTHCGELKQFYPSPLAGSNTTA